MKKIDVVILISYKSFKSRSITRDKEGYSVIISQSIRKVSRLQITLFQMLKAK